MIQQFVNWFRSASPYIHAHRGRTFVIYFEGEVVQSAYFAYLSQDIALLNSLGIRLVLIYGIRPQIEKNLQIRGLKINYVNGLRITDAETLNCVKAACGEVYIDIESHLSRGLVNTPMPDVRIHTACGNFIIAKPVGIRDGVDYCYTGEVRRVDATAIIHRLDEGCIVLIPPIGYSPTGEIFNLFSEDVAAEVAIALKAAKWICLTESDGMLDSQGQLIRQLTLLEAERLLEQQDDINNQRQLANAIRACQQGVQRVHLVTRQIEGSLLLELFSRDGIGTLISTDPFENLRRAVISDVRGLLELIEPLEESGVLVRRSREKLEVEINHFIVQERDGMIIACAALYPFFQENMAELACLAVRQDYQRQHRGETLLAFLEREARQQGVKRIFVLTTRTAHWFQERGFVSADLASLPIAKQTLYNYQRRSKVFIKELG